MNNSLEGREELEVQSESTQKTGEALSVQKQADLAEICKTGQEKSGTAFHTIEIDTSTPTREDDSEAQSKESPSQNSDETRSRAQGKSRKSSAKLQKVDKAYTISR